MLYRMAAHFYMAVDRLSAHDLRPSKISAATVCPTARLLQLPNELLLEIFNLLPKPSQLSLRHVCRQLHLRTPSTRSNTAGQPSTCERHALLRVNEENCNIRSGRRRCITCGELAPLTHFRWDAAPICKWHDGWFMSRDIPKQVEPELRSKLRSLPQDLKCWISLERVYCAHRKDVIHWDIGECNCGCDVCGHFGVVCYVRVSATNAEGAMLDLVDGEQGLDMMETMRRRTAYEGKKVNRMRVVALNDL